MTHHLHEDDGANLFPYSETGTSGCLSVDSEAQRFARVTSEAPSTAERNLYIR
jgi:hypothetical protein